jgi:hypothetical protein
MTMPREQASMHETRELRGGRMRVVSEDTVRERIRWRGFDTG